MCDSLLSENQTVQESPNSRFLSLCLSAMLFVRVSVIRVCWYRSVSSFTAWFLSRTNRIMSRQCLGQWEAKQLPKALPDGQGLSKQEKVLVWWAVPAQLRDSRWVEEEQRELNCSCVPHQSRHLPSLAQVPRLQLFFIPYAACATVTRLLICLCPCLLSPPYCFPLFVILASCYFGISFLGFHSFTLPRIFPNISPHLLHIPPRSHLPLAPTSQPKHHVPAAISHSFLLRYSRNPLPAWLRDGWRYGGGSPPLSRRSSMEWRGSNMHRWVQGLMCGLCSRLLWISLQRSRVELGSACVFICLFVLGLMLLNGVVSKSKSNQSLFIKCTTIQQTVLDAVNGMSFPFTPSVNSPPAAGEPLRFYVLCVRLLFAEVFPLFEGSFMHCERRWEVAQLTVRALCAARSTTLPCWLGR